MVAFNLSCFIYVFNCFDLALYFVGCPESIRVVSYVLNPNNNDNNNLKQ